MMDMNSKAIGSRLQNGALTSEQVGAYNVYKGARYVPKIMGQWNANVNYEPLSIVINQGNSYTSAQYVPAGVELQENGPFWFLTGNFNGQIASVQQTVNENSNNININKSNIDTINNSLYNRNLLLIADSYGFFPGESYSWTGLIKNYYENVQIIQRQGYGFTTTPNLKDLVVENIDSLVNKELITDVIIGCSYNDGRMYAENITSLANITLKIHEFYDYIITQCPKANVWLAPIGWDCGHYSTEYTQPSTNQMFAVNNTYLGSFYKKLRIIQNPMYVMMWPPFFNADGVHPNSQGSYYLANIILGNISGNNLFNINYIPVVDTDYTTTATINSGLSTLFTYHDDTVLWKLVSYGMSNTNSEILTFKQNKGVMKVEDNAISVMGYFSGTLNGEEYSGAVLFLLTNNKLEMYKGANLVTSYNGILRFNVALSKFQSTTGF